MTSLTTVTLSDDALKGMSINLQNGATGPEPLNLSQSDGPMDLIFDTEDDWLQMRSTLDTTASLNTTALKSDITLDDTQDGGLDFEIGLEDELDFDGAGAESCLKVHYRSGPLTGYLY